MLDTHYHLDQLDDETLHRLMEEAAEIRNIIAPATGLHSLERLLRIKNQYNERVEIGAGIHPEREMNGEIREEKKNIIQWIKENPSKIRAIGEVGLPYYSLENKQPNAIPEIAWEILYDFLAVVSKLKLPVILHAVHTMAQPCLEAVKQHNIEKAVFHWLKAPDEVVHQIVDSGYYISVTPEVVYRERDQHLVRLVPIEQLLLETDGPYPHQGIYEGKLTHPLWIRDSIQAIAGIHGKLEEEIEQVTTQNALRFFFS
jgi:TatD DNase family protein